MSFTIDTRYMTSVHSFADAERVWAAANPWRSEDASWRPLDGTRKLHMRLVKLGDGFGYQCVLHQTAVVTYYADGSVALRCYNSQSTQAFAWMVSPTGCDPVSCKGRMFWQVQADAGPRFYREGREALQLQPMGKHWELTNLPREHNDWVLDLKQAASVRKRLKPYATWQTATARLGILPRTAYAPQSRAHVKELLSAPDQTDRYYEIAEVLGHPSNFLPLAYEIAGARTKVPTPYDRLPRSFA